jgi:hypothetical protein
MKHKTHLPGNSWRSSEQVRWTYGAEDVDTSNREVADEILPMTVKNVNSRTDIPSPLREEVPVQIDTWDISPPAHDGTYSVTATINGVLYKRIPIVRDSQTGELILKTDGVCITLDPEESDALKAKIREMLGWDYHV